MEKKDIREQYLSIRDQMSEAECMEKSALILKKLLKTDAFLRAWKVGLYASTGNEVITYPLIAKSKMLDKGVSFPRILDTDKKSMVFQYVLGMQDLKPGKFGILEPDENSTVMENPDVIIMPLVAFDGEKNRIGHGGGYYDRYLLEHPDTVKIALAYELQKTGRIEISEHDIRPDLIITEENIYE